MQSFRKKKGVERRKKYRDSKICRSKEGGKQRYRGKRETEDKKNEEKEKRHN